MKTHHPAALRRALAAMAAATLAAALVTACGGGVDTGGTGSPQSFSAGRVSGFGSIVVNGVHYDESSASVTDDDGNTRNASDIKLGMIVEVHGGAIDKDDVTGRSSATADSVQIASEIKGNAETVDAAGGRLTVIGQTVIVNSATQFDDDLPDRLDSVRPGNPVEIFAFLDPSTGSYTATRIEIEDDPLSNFKLRGIVAGLDTTAKTFTIGGAVVSYASVPSGALPALANGVLVKVKLQPVQQAGVWVATEVEVKDQDVDDDAEVELEGYITDFVSSASFKVGGVPVDASGTTVEFEDGTASALANGVRVEVEGQTANGVLVAKKVEFEDADDDDLEFEFEGPIQAADATAKTIVVHGVTIAYDDATVFKDGKTAADLIVGAQVEAKGTLSANLLATEIEFDD